MNMTTEDGLAVLRIEAGKANAINPEFLAGLDRLLAEFEESDARAAVLTGYDGFFSAGLDLVQLECLERPAMKELMQSFERVMGRIFRCPRPVVAAINGHAIAGGCVLALQADYRVMADGKARMGLNETQLGVGLPTLVIESLRCQLLPDSWMPVALEGGLFDSEQALLLGLVDEIGEPEEVLEIASSKARDLGAIPAAAYAQVKLALRRPALEILDGDTEAASEAWLDTWFAEVTRERLHAAIERLSAKR